MPKKFNMEIKIIKICKSDDGQCVIDFTDDMDRDYIYEHTINIYHKCVFFQAHRSEKEWDMIKIMVWFLQHYTKLKEGETHTIPSAKLCDKDIPSPNLGERHDK